MGNRVTHYTSKEGGVYKKWPFTTGPSKQELLLTNLSSEGLSAWGVPETDMAILVHALIFDDGTRWDAVNGFTADKVEVPK